MPRMFRVCFILVAMCFVVAEFQTSAHAQTGVLQDHLTWTPWLQAGDRIWGAVMRIEPKLKNVIGDGQHIAVSVADLDHDGRNDIILNFWDPDSCGADGCAYLVLSNNGRLKRSFIARDFKRQGNGVNIDGRYYPL